MVSQDIGRKPKIVVLGGINMDVVATVRRMPEPGETVRAGLPRVVDVQCGFDYEPGTALNGQMSARFTIAAALADGNALPAQYTDERLKDPELVELAIDDGPPRAAACHFADELDLAGIATVRRDAQEATA